MHIKYFCHFHPLCLPHLPPLPLNPLLLLPSLFSCCYFILFCRKPLMLIRVVFMSIGVGYLLDHMHPASTYVTKENESSSPSSHPLPQLLKERWGLMRPSHIQDPMLMDPIILSGCCEFPRATAGGYPEDKSFPVLPILPFSHPSPHVFWGLVGVNIDVPFRALSSI